MISSCICITKYKGFTLSFLENNAKMEYLSIADDNNTIGNIYVGIVKHAVKSLDAYFVEYDEGHLGFLSKNDILDELRVCEGETVLVQIVKEASKNKEAVLTTKLCLTGRYAVVEKNSDGLLSISRKINGQDRERIRDVVVFDPSYSIIVRTNAKDLDNVDLLNDEIADLTKKLQNIYDIASTRAGRCLVYKPTNDYEMFVNSIRAQDYELIITDEIDIYNKLSSMNVKLYEDSLPFAKLHAIESKLEELLSSRVWLKNGGNIVIQYTEALTVIDVNSAKSIGKKDREKSLLETNCEAAIEIARQLRLRNISGIIVIDFINTHNKDSESKLIEILKSEISKDNVRCDFVEYTKLGLVHLVRKKIKAPIYEVLNGFCVDVL